MGDSFTQDSLQSHTNDDTLLTSDSLVIMAVCIQRHCIGIATYIAETAEISIMDSIQDQCLEEQLNPLVFAISMHSPTVLIVGENMAADIKTKILDAIPDDCRVVLVKPWWFSRSNCEKNVEELWISGMPQDLNVEDRKHYIYSLVPVAASDEVLGSLGACLSVIYAQKLLGNVELLSGEKLHMLQSLSQSNLKERLQYDLPTLSALQIFSSDKHPSNFIGNTKEGLSLFALLDHCCTLHGKKLLKNWLLHPITNVHEIRLRQDEVDYLFNLPTEMLLSIQDTLGMMRNVSPILKQLISCQGCGRTNKSHLQMLYKHVSSAVQLQDTCSQLLQWRVPLVEVACVEDLARMNKAESFGLLAALNRTLDFKALESEDDFFVSHGISGTLDQLKSTYKQLPGILNNVLEEELQRIPSALIRKHEKTEWAISHLPQFGFVIKMPELLSPDLLEVFTDYEFLSEYSKDFFLYKSRSTLFLDKQFGNLYSKVLDLETAILSQFTFEILQIPLWKDLVEKTARLDVFLSLASVAKSHNFKRPKVVDENVIKIRNGRHPLNEQTVQGSFIPNDSLFLQDSDRIHIITGPNFSGKTIYAKQVALIVYMAHIGSFVPADEAVIGACDKILTRIDSIDASSFGQSSFMMDLIQVLNILRNATSRSLILLDEFGRGTGSQDGFGLFFSLLTALAERPYPPRIIACTHFGCSTYVQHMPTYIHMAFRKMECFIENKTNQALSNQTDNKSKRITIMHQSDSKVIYLYRLVQGISDNALGIFCARLAGLSEPICQRAYEILSACSSQDKNIQIIEGINDSNKQELSTVHLFEKTDLSSIDAVKGFFESIF